MKYMFIFSMALAGLGAGCVNTDPVDEPIADAELAEQGNHGHIGNGDNGHCGHLGGPHNPPGQAGTTLTVSKTVTALNENVNRYDWTLQKSAVASPNPLELGSGQTGTVTYTLTVNRTNLTVTHLLHLSGVITVVNGGAEATQNLSILDQVECKPPGNNPFVVVGSVPITVTQQIAAGATAQYPYTIDVPFPTTASACRNVASATITNHSGNLGNPDVTLTRVSFPIPTTVTTIDETASVADVQQCPTGAGFTCALANPVPSFPITFSGPFPQSFSFVKNVTNSTAACGTSANLTNTATLTPSNHTPSPPITASATVPITTPECGFVAGGYCTYTKGGYAASGVPGQLFDANYLTVFSSGLTIGAAAPGFSAFWAATATGQANLKSYVNFAPSGAPGALTANFTNATTTVQTGGGNLAEQTTTLTLNVGFNDAGVLGGSQNSSTPFGNLVFCNVPTGTTASIVGKTIDQVLADANVAIGTGTFPSYVTTFGNLNGLVTSLNESFDNCTLTTFATTNLCFP